METVLLRLTGPMQSYGTAAHWEERGTRRRPTKSAVIGLVANALGLAHDEPLHHLARMTFAVRADRPGREIRDQQTAGGGHFPPAGENPPNSESRYGAPRDPGLNRDGTLRPSRQKRSRDPVLITKHYLEDAGFLAGLSTDDATLAAAIDGALRRPARVLFLGRHCCPPAQSVAHGITPYGPGQWPGRVPLLPEATAAEPTVWTEAQQPAAGAWPSPENPLQFSTRTHTTLFLQASNVLPPAPELSR
ncbi:type I-E CRISPR-associated protein Cas5/CasD [Streptomyces sp. BE147]|uniref:type I-E CRISPR-associated protein Cas5/CasD n=1 Tax=Streptomyces sp. BE147 TaxID=3002524 RepID=UPI002E77B40A|nr:type I-E CRISPR-associated protein Cas5/CasD [Streptomyces sp. BE147]MEE1742275.1 type I-E CRISPR-associated protein Cas5/CasD [Streptomyces sp. BE147]